MIFIFSDYTLNGYITNLSAVDSMASVIEYKMQLLNIYLMNGELYEMIITLSTFWIILFSF